MSKEIVNKALLTILGGSLGFGLSQLTVTGEVKVHSVQLLALQEGFRLEQARTDARIFEVIKLVKENMELSHQLIDENRELIAFLKAR